MEGRYKGNIARLMLGNVEKAELLDSYVESVFPQKEKVVQPIKNCTAIKKEMQVKLDNKLIRE